MLIAQISDMHISTPGSRNDRVFRTAEHLARAVAHLNGLQPRPDLVLATGDLVERGEVNEYERLREILAPLALPLFLIPGNHDDRRNLSNVFANHAYLPRNGDFVQYTWKTGRCAWWPSTRWSRERVEAPVRGAAGVAGDATAERPERSMFVLMYHGHSRRGSPHGRHGLDGIDALVVVIAVIFKWSASPVVIFTTIVRRFAGTVACTCPATAHHRPRSSSGAGLAAVMEAPACLLHLWMGGMDGLGPTRA